MQSVAMQVKKNDQAAVMSMAAPSSYCRKPSWMDGGEPPTSDEKGRVCGSQGTDFHPGVNGRSGAPSGIKIHFAPRSGSLSGGGSVLY